MRAYGRRHRRWRNRNAQPLMIVADGGYFADFLAAIGRLLFRYRSELAPFTTGAVLTVGSAVLHLEHAAWWPYVLGSAGALLVLVVTTGAPFRLDRISERVYAGALILAADPHAESIRWPGVSVRSITQSLTLGVFEDAEPVRISLLRRHGLLGGIAGSGKSGVLNVIAANLAACADVVLWAIDLKGGMELRPWASCLDRLATTPSEAARLLRDAVAIVETRARAMAEDESRVWEPSPQHPALVIIVDEYAELAEHAPSAVESADSVARRGRAVAVTLLAATQRPTQQAMGRGAVRSQMDVRVCLRVRERRDVDLILGQGMLAAGWTAHTLDAPGKFLLSAEGHDRPRRARAYLVTDDDVRAEAARWAPFRPALDELSATALDATHAAAEDDLGEVVDAEIVDDPTDPDTALWAALRTAPETGVSVPELMMTIGMGRTWIYDRLQSHAAAGRAEQVSRGRWRATDPHRERPAV